MDINWNFFFSFWGMVLGAVLFVLPIVIGFKRMVEADEFLDLCTGLGIALSPFVIATLLFRHRYQDKGSIVCLKRF